MRPQRIRPHPVEIVLFGRHCRFTTQVLAALLTAGHVVTSVVLPRRGGGGVQVLLPPSLKPRLALARTGEQIAVLPNVASLAWSGGASLIESPRDQLPTLPDRFAMLRRGVIISACFPWRFPAEILEASPLGAFNIHPSLLPRHRGPDPLFWTFHAGDRETGVTIHRMVANLDAGPIVLQQRLALPVRSRYERADQLTIDLGASMIVKVVESLQSGLLDETEQSGSGISYESFPDDRALRISPGWSAERAFRFVYGAGGSYGPFLIARPGDAPISVTDALEFSVDHFPGDTHLRDKRQAIVRFCDGWVTFATDQPDE